MDTSAVLSWKAGADGHCPTTAYAIKVAIDDPYKYVWDRTVTATTMTVTGLSAGTKYQATLFAYAQSCGTPSESTRIWFTTTGGAPPPPPGSKPNAATDFLASSITDTSAVLSWTAGADGDCPATEFDVYVERYTDGRVVWERQEMTAATVTVTVTGLLRATVYVALIDTYGEACDAYDEGTVKIQFTTTGGSDGAAPGSDASALTISVADVSVTEGDRGTTAMNFTVTLSGSPSHKVEIRATSRGVGMATAPDRTPPTARGTGHGRDFFQFTNRNLVFEAGATGAALTKTVKVVVYGDELDEDDETLILRLNNLRTEATNVSFAGGEKSLEATGTITDDDEGKTPREISVSNTSVAEGAEGERTELTFTITLSETPTHEVRVRATVRGAGIKVTLAPTPTAKGTAGEGRDFIQFSNRDVVFAAGATGAALMQTVKVVILGDTVVEGDETLSLRLNNLRTTDGLVRFTGGAKRLFATGTITDDDTN